MVVTKDDSAPPPYTPVPAPGQPSAVGEGQVRPYQTAQFPALASGAGTSAGEGLLPAPAAAGRDWRVADKRARRRFLGAFLWAIAIWLLVGLLLGGAGAMDYGRHPHDRPHRPGRNH
ncbi:hypothetical protein CALVIDRAFT_566007 [Calocera viscosa TUFC12733]|uniref:Uncharacterized protein n=1 Tax=Calocera viscosa (strain TUFC12733) TaxID=1330018 RepID=A0A167JXM0_CALVF|nr:hypothetical protein CALVIDRAFT_566007 [Calocera viscosa TUFC12733]